MSHSDGTHVSPVFGEGWPVCPGTVPLRTVIHDRVLAGACCCHAEVFRSALFKVPALQSCLSSAASPAVFTLADVSASSSQVHFVVC